MTAQTPPGWDPWHVDRDDQLFRNRRLRLEGAAWWRRMRTYGRPDAEENAAKIAAVPQIHRLAEVRSGTREEAGLPYDGTFVDEALKAAGEGP